MNSLALDQCKSCGDTVWFGRCKSCGQAHQACICGEINARNCPVHQEGKNE